MAIRHFLLTSAAMMSAHTIVGIPASASPGPMPSIQKSELPADMRINDAGSGTLMFSTSTPGRYIKAPLVAADVNVDISGPVIRTTLSQTFENTSDEWIEGVYVFPLPENAAVDRLRMVIGGRLIEGQIKEKKQAKIIYEQAKAEGKKASLVEQQRPNIFTASVANIGPHESVSIQIEYQDKAEMKDGVFAMRFPMTVAPRYSPPQEIVQVATIEGQRSVILDPVLDRHAITPPLNLPQEEPVEYMRLPVSMTINLDAGFDLKDVTSPYHHISVTGLDEDSAQIKLTEGRVPANRDFLLEWSAQHSDAPYSALFKQTIGEHSYLLSMLTPPKSGLSEDAQQTPSHARESIFVIDTSGSMGGTSIAQARASLLLALDHLEAGDTFNIIRFASNHSSFESRPVPANAENLKRARRWVSRLNADGGTNMAPALTAALTGQGQAGKRVRQVIFITDGAIGNERQLFAQIQDQINTARLFPVGIGSAPNGFFMSRAAKFGRGSFVRIGDIDEVQSRMGTLFAAIDSPVLTNVQTSVRGETFPARLPDVYSGDPVVSISRLKTSDLPETISMTGDLAGNVWREDKALSGAEQANGLSVLWARAKIADLEESRFDRAGADKIDDEILRTALAHHIVSRLTSLVAVDITPSRPASTPLNRAAVPTMLPKGWDFGKAPIRPAPQQDVHMQNSIAPSPMAAPQSLHLPGTASPHQILAMLGALLLLLGLYLNFGGFKNVRQKICGGEYDPRR